MRHNSSWARCGHAPDGGVSICHGDVAAGPERAGVGVVVTVAVTLPVGVTGFDVGGPVGVGVVGVGAGVVELAVGEGDRVRVGLAVVVTLGVPSTGDGGGGRTSR